MNKKKVFLCITKSNWGGAQKYVYDIATNAPKDEFDMTVLLGGDGELKQKLDEAGIQTRLLKNSQRDMSAKKDFGLFFELRKIFRADMPDVVHLNSSKMGFIGALAARCAGRRRPKIIFIAHGWAFNEDRPWWQKIFFRLLHVATILLADKTIAVSEITKKQIGSPWNKKIIVIYNGQKEIDFLDKTSARKILLEKIPQKNIPSDAVLIGTISELHKTKGLKYAIEAIAKIPENVIFIIIGDGEERKNLQKLIADFGMTEKVFLLGNVPSASDYLKAFDIFTLTSITEALPYVLLEAGGAGLPVLASKVGGIPEIIADGETGILCLPRNINFIRKTIEWYLQNPETAKRFGQNLEQKVTTEFAMTDMLAKTFALYRI